MIAPAAHECCDGLFRQETRMEASINPPRSRFRNVLQMTAWIVGAIAIWIAEILVFERWGYVTGLKILAAAILISGFVLMGVGLRRLKIASDTNGKEYSYGRGVNAIMLSAVITSGAAIGQQLYFQKAWYWSVPLCSEVAKACF
jgi:hypothetical protein